MRCKVLLALIGGLFATASIAKAEQLGALLTGYEEVPPVSTTASGEFLATVSPDGSNIQYTETYSGLQAPVTQSHIHVGQPAVNGSIVIFLCPDRGQSGSDRAGTAVPARGNGVGDDNAGQCHRRRDQTQQLEAKDLVAVITAIHVGDGYANVHTTASPGGEIRGQIRVIAK